MPNGDGKALVTGASTGLGREIALTLARAGYDVALADQDVALLDPVLGHDDLADVTAVPVALQLLSEAGIRDGFASAVEGLGGLDLVVNNAGVPLLQQAVDVTWDEWDALMNVNLKGAYFLAARLAEHCMSKGNPDTVVNICLLYPSPSPSD